MKSDTEIEKICAQIDRLLDAGESQSAIPLLRSVAQEGDAWGQYMLGLAYQDGDGVRKSRVSAEKWYRLSAAQGYDSALLNLGILHATARLPRYEEAIQLFRKAARKGNRNAMFNLGLYYELGRAVKPNLLTSFKWYKQAAELGDQEAQCYVGYCYHEGAGVRQNAREAIRWYRKSARKGNKTAMFNLGLCYLEGDGVQENQRKALVWITQSAELGHSNAEKKLRELVD